MAGLVENGMLPLKPGHFYGSSLPRPRFYSNGKTARVDPPPPVNESFLRWADDAHWSMGGRSYKRHRMQGKIEGRLKNLRDEAEDSDDEMSPPKVVVRRSKLPPAKVASVPSVLRRPDVTSPVPSVLKKADLTPRRAGLRSCVDESVRSPVPNAKTPKRRLPLGVELSSNSPGASGGEQGVKSPVAFGGEHSLESPEVTARLTQLDTIQSDVRLPLNFDSPLLSSSQAPSEDYASPLPSSCARVSVVPGSVEFPVRRRIERTSEEPMIRVNLAQTGYMRPNRGPTRLSARGAAMGLFNRVTAYDEVKLSLE